MKYPEAFINKCKRLYPEWIQLHKCLDNGSPCIAPMLKECGPQTFHFNEILNAKSLEELQQKARLMKERKELIKECEEVIEQCRKETNDRYLEAEKARFNRMRVGRI